jgi:Tfp pilus assembly protein FimT
VNGYTALMVITTIVSLLAVAQFSALADRDRMLALSERLAHQEASRQAKAESLARGEAEQARTQAEKAEREATKQRNRDDREAEVAQKNLFYAQMHLAQQA